MNLDQARAVAEEYFNGVRPLDRALPVGVYGFSEGFVAWVRELDPDDPAVLPDTVGGGCIVIDRATGEVVSRPMLDPETVAELWPGRTPR
ncbi:hypothetical protein [Nonomuraea pusilla]|uniref:Immunity protein 35 n=1 Tax=Nonomuraea pusilla TaxID=46177 RepID=A0A1H7WAS1_9ACTN|nr:hypothetical protein [Nonomuraea pusilla]SEM18444.1 hypothetical protein SAMN05660976_04432 [Nonomuraea pusilla]